MITLDKAKKIAEREIESVINNSARLKNYKFGDVRLRQDYGFAWHFFAGSEELINEGVVPGAISALVGKDGRIWTNEEFEAYISAAPEKLKAA